MPAPLLAQCVILALFAAWVGFGYRALTAGVIGANIGGGVLLLVTPAIAIAAVASALVLAYRASRRTKRTTQPDR